MREICEFRVAEEFASKLFDDEEGTKLGDSIRKIVLPTNDPRYKKVGDLQREIRASLGDSFFYGWNIRHIYSKPETIAAEVLRLIVAPVFEPAGEECGTKYDEGSACPDCGAGAKQADPLYLSVKRIPKGKDFAKTIAGEIVVSRRVVELFRRNAITGITSQPVRINPATSAESKDWFQMMIQSGNAEIVSPTRVGIDPFDDDRKGEYRCPRGDLVGLNLLSEVSVASAICGRADISCTRQFIGARRGLLRPERIVLISQRVRELIESAELKGCLIEIAHLKREQSRC